MISFLIKDNTNISNFLEGDDSYIPISELQYLHVRPLLRPNFLTEIDTLVKSVGEKLITKKVGGKPIDQLTELAITIGCALKDPTLSNDDARTILFALRKLYKLCKTLDKKL